MDTLQSDGSYVYLSVTREELGKMVAQNIVEHIDPTKMFNNTRSIIAGDIGNNHVLKIMYCLSGFLVDTEEFDPLEFDKFLDRLLEISDDWHI
jgi:hypothetical protein